MNLLYNIIIFLHYFSIKIASVFNVKARQWIEGRKNIFERMLYYQNKDAKLIWFHCASLGEFEQGRPVMEELKRENPDIKLLVTFYSPSGFEAMKGYKNADYIFYLPLDKPSHVKRFFNIWKPSIAVFIKYEFWYNYFNEAYKRKIPLILVSATFRSNQHFFKFYGFWFRSQLKKITYILAQNDDSVDLLINSGVKNVLLSGDTRFDRVYDISLNPAKYRDIEAFIGSSRVFIVGSMWDKDGEIIAELVNRGYNDNIKYIVAPHEIDECKINDFSNKLNSKVVKLSDTDKSEYSSAKVLIIDRIGILCHVYQYATIAYIGGGFGKGIHNILEAAVFGTPVIFGPNYKKFNEAIELVKCGGAFPITNLKELLHINDKLLGNYNLLENASKCSKEYVYQNKGVAGKAVSVISSFI